MKPIKQWTIQQLVTAGFAAIITFGATVDGLATGFRTIGDLQPFMLKSDVAELKTSQNADLQAAKIEVAGQLQTIQKLVDTNLESLSALRWDEAADRADRWQSELAEMNDQAITLQSRLAKADDPVVSRLLRDLQGRISTKQQKLTRLLCDLERRDDPSRTC